MHACSPLSVVSNTAGKLRLVLNLTSNQFLHADRFKYEDLHIAALLLESMNIYISLT